jgi:amino acid adenylation domain-containing protein
MVQSPDVIATYIALMKLGCPVVLLTPDFPRERVRFLCRGASPVFLFFRGEAPNIPEDSAANIMNLLEISDLGRFDPGNFAEAPSFEKTAVLFHTSGSTGYPKTVKVLHRGLAALVWKQPYINFGPGDVMAQISDLAFDAASFEIWGSLCIGACLALIPGGQRLSPENLLKEFKSQGVTAVFFTTSYFHLLANRTPGALNSVPHVYFGGEAAHIEAVRKVLQAGGPRHLWNMYGPTETTTFALGFRIEDDLPGHASVPIGKPIAHYRTKVLDAELEEVPAGGRGELLIGGAGVSGGYLGEGQSNTARFIEDPKKPGDMLYRTGDIVSLAPDGNLLFHGRRDDQVKIHGYRIELGEIEAAMLGQPGVHSAVAILKNLPSGPSLVAFVSPDSLKSNELLAALGKTLPAFMLPKHICPVGEIPRNANGKIDRQALARIPIELGRCNAGEPAGDLEEALLGLWRRVLRRVDLGVLDQFSDMGGDSLSGVELLAEIESATGVKLPLQSLLQHGCVREIARLIESNDPIPGCENVVRLEEGGRLTPLFIIGGGGAHLLYLKKLARHFANERPVYGVTLRGESESEHGWKRIEIYAGEKLSKLLEIQPRGPFLLAGHSLGGLVALELAIRLQSEGREVAFLGLLDTFPPGYRLPRISWFRTLRSNWRLVRTLKPTLWFGYFVDLLQMRLLRSFRKRELHDRSRFGKQSTRLAHQMSHDLYQPLPYQRPVCVFESEGGLGLAVGSREHWLSFAPQAKFMTIPGDHWTMLKTPNVEILHQQFQKSVPNSA